MAQAAPRARLFVALELPGRVREALVSWRSEVLGDIGGLRPVAAERLHVTLCFLGSTPLEGIENVIQTCGSVAGVTAPRLIVGEPIWLPRRRPRVLSVRLHDSQGRLACLQSELSTLLERAGWYEPEGRDYLPHVTIARTGRTSAPARRATQAPLPRPPALEFTARQITLFRSRLSRDGARYEPLAGVQLSRA